MLEIYPRVSCFTLHILPLFLFFFCFSFVRQSRRPFVLHCLASPSCFFVACLFGSWIFSCHFLKQAFYYSSVFVVCLFFYPNYNVAKMPATVQLVQLSLVCTLG